LGHKGFFYVAILAIAFNHNAVGDEVRLAGSGGVWLEHLAKNLGCLRNVKAADTTV